MSSRGARLASAAVLCWLGACGAPAPHATPGLHLSVQNLKSGQVVDSVPCLGSELPSFHQHAHLEIVLDGKEITIPAGIGVGRPWAQSSDGFISGGGCFGWLHTHDSTGVIHVVSQEAKTFTVGQLFSVWGHPISGGNVLGYSGPVTAYVNTEKFSGDIRTIPLTNLSSIELELGRTVAPSPNYFFGGVRR